MGIRGAFLCCLVMSLLFAASLCHGEDETVEVVGVGECADCAQSNIKASQAFSGLGVSIDCKATNGNLKTRGVGELNEEGKFKVTLPNEIIEEDGKLKEECFVQLQYSTASSATVPCTAHNGLDYSSKIVFKSKTINVKHTFGLPVTLKFSWPLSCTSFPNIPPISKKLSIPKKLPRPRSPKDVSSGGRSTLAIAPTLILQFFGLIWYF